MNSSTQDSARTVRSVPIAVLAALAMLAALLVGTVGSHDPAHAEGHASHATAQRAMTVRQLAFHDQMRKLWEDHITWTRLAIVAFADGSAGFPATADRLLANQVDIGNAIKPFYGTAAGNQLTALLHDHITGAVAVLQAAKAGDSAAFATAKDAWYVNGNQVADLISSLDAKVWPQAAMRDMMKVHLDQTLAEGAAELGGDYATSISKYDEVHAHILMMADSLSSGIVKQFPGRFR